jgi:predicted CoA-binding protein
MTALDEAVHEFLELRRIAVAGVSRHGDVSANFIYKKLRDAGYEVFAVNPNADVVEGDRCYHTLAEIPGGVEGVVIGTHPDVTIDVVRECIAAGVRHVWMHRLMGEGSVDDEAVKLCEENDIDVIPGACPMMYVPPIDFGHKCFRWILSMTGGLPKPIEHEEHEAIS